MRGIEIVRAAHESFTTAMALGLRVAGAVAVAAAVAAAAVLPARARSRVADVARADAGLVATSAAI